MWKESIPLSAPADLGEVLPPMESGVFFTLQADRNCTSRSNPPMNETDFHWRTYVHLIGTRQCSQPSELYSEHLSGRAGQWTGRRGLPRVHRRSEPYPAQLDRRRGREQPVRWAERDAAQSANRPASALTGAVSQPRLVATQVQRNSLKPPRALSLSFRFAEVRSARRHSA